MIFFVIIYKFKGRILFISLIMYCYFLIFILLLFLFLNIWKLLQIRSSSCETFFIYIRLPRVQSTILNCLRFIIVKVERICLICNFLLIYSLKIKLLRLYLPRLYGISNIKFILFLLLLQSEWLRSKVSAIRILIYSFLTIITLSVIISLYSRLILSRVYLISA